MWIFSSWKVRTITRHRLSSLTDGNTKSELCVDERLKNHDGHRNGVHGLKLICFQLYVQWLGGDRIVVATESASNINLQEQNLNNH